MIQSPLILLLILTGAAEGHSDEDTSILLESFSAPQHKWKTLNDPVMGGESHGNFTVRTVDKHGFPDISSCQGLSLTLSSFNEYTGYRVSFGNKHAPHGKRFAYGFKANLKIDGNDSKVIIPFSEFTDYWDDATGDAIVKCKDDAQYCPDEFTLRNIRTLALWAEGVAGSVSLDVHDIYAVDCNAQE